MLDKKDIFGHILDNFSEPTSWFKEDGVIYFSNRAFKEIFSNKLVSSNINSIFEDKSFLSACLQQAKNNRMFNAHTVFNLKSQDKIDVDLVFIYLDEEEFMMVITSPLESLLRKELVATEKRYKELVENANSIILKLDLNGKITFINEYAQELFGYSAQEVLGKELMGTILPELDSEGKNLKEFISDFLRDPDKYSYNENENISKDGRRFYVSWTNKAISDGMGNIREIICIGHDINERKNFENMIIEKNKELEEIGRLKSELTSSISHDLRTPLSSIQEGVSIVYSEMAGSLNDDQKKFLNIVKNNLDRLSRLMNDILDIEKFDSGRIYLKTYMKDNSITSIVKEAVESMRMEASRHSIDIELSLPEEELFLSCDKDRMMQVLVNLISNAIRYNKEQGKIFVRLGRFDGKIVIEVEDTGIGIKDNDKQKIFDRFFQVISDAPRRSGGTGLGLAISKSIVEMHKGRIWVDSVYGQGSKFILEFQQ